jgi:hypothetical protein
MIPDLGKDSGYENGRAQSTPVRWINRRRNYKQGIGFGIETAP